jgi:hypothetical protein
VSGRPGASRYVYGATVTAAAGLLLFGPVWTAVRFTQALGEFHWMQLAYDEPYYFWQLYWQIADGGPILNYRFFSKLLGGLLLSFGASFDLMVSVYAIVNPLLVFAGALFLASQWEKRSVGRVVWALLLVLSFDLLSGSSRIVDYDPPAVDVEAIVGNPAILKGDIISFFMFHRRPEPQSSWVVFFPYLAMLLGAFLHGRRRLYLAVCAATPFLSLIYINVAVVALLIFVPLSLLSLLVHRRPIALAFVVTVVVTALAFALVLRGDSSSAIVAQTVIRTHMPILRPSVVIGLAGLVWVLWRLRAHGPSPQSLAAAVLFAIPPITLNQQIVTGIAVMPQNWEYYINYICLVTGLGLMSGRFLSAAFEDRGGWRWIVPFGLLYFIGFTVVQGELRNEVNWSLDNARSVLFAKLLAEAKTKVDRIDAVILPHVYDESLFLTRVPHGTKVFGGYNWLILNPPPDWREGASLEDHARAARASIAIGLETLFRSGVTPEELQKNMQAEIASGDCWLGLWYFFSLNDCWPAFMNYTSPGTQRLGASVPALIAMYRRYLEHDAARDLARQQILLIRNQPLPDGVGPLIDNELVATASVDLRGTPIHAYAYIQRPRKP